jgi:uncharacterized membrane protein
MKRYLALILFLTSNSAFAMEKMQCGGTEPFWDVTLTDQLVIFDLSGDRKAFIQPVFAPATGASGDYVTSVSAKGKTGQITGFIVNETLMILADERGRLPSDRFTYKAYCSDGMSDRGFPFSIHLMVDGKPYTGCCANASHPPVGQDGR